MQSYLIDAQIDPAAQTLTATALVRFIPLDDTSTVTFELNNALNLTKVTDEDGRQIPASRMQQDMSVRLSLPQTLPKGKPRRSDVCLRRQADGQRRIAGVRDQVRGDSSRFRVPDVSGALVPGERLHDGPLQLRSEGHGADGLQGGRQRHRRNEKAPDGHELRRGSSYDQASFPGSFAVVRGRPEADQLRRRHHLLLLRAKPPTWRAPTARKSPKR